MTFGLCPKCINFTLVTKHHIFPRRHKDHWSQAQRDTKVILCRKCHDELEAMIPEEFQETETYVEVVEAFLGVTTISERITA